MSQCCIKLQCLREISKSSLDMFPALTCFFWNNSTIRNLCWCINEKSYPFQSWISFKEAFCCQYVPMVTRISCRWKASYDSRELAEHVSCIYWYLKHQINTFLQERLKVVFFLFPRRKPACFFEYLLILLCICLEGICLQPYVKQKCRNLPLLVMAVECSTLPQNGYKNPSFTSV